MVEKMSVYTQGGSRVTLDKTQNVAQGLFLEKKIPPFSGNKITNPQVEICVTWKKILIFDSENFTTLFWKNFSSFPASIRKKFTI